MRCSLHSPKRVFELNFYFPCVRPQAVSEQQAAVIGFPGNLDPSSVFDLRTVSKPAHRQRLLRSKGHLECGILANSYDHRFGELVKVIRVELGYICAKCSPISLHSKCHIKMVHLCNSLQYYLQQLVFLVCSGLLLRNGKRQSCHRCSSGSSACD